MIWTLAIIITACIWWAYHLGRVHGKMESQHRLDDYWDEGEPGDVVYLGCDANTNEEKYFDELQVHIDNSKDPVHIEDVRLTHNSMWFTSYGSWVRAQKIRQNERMPMKSECVFDMSFNDGDTNYKLHGCLINEMRVKDFIEIEVVYDYAETSQIKQK